MVHKEQKCMLYMHTKIVNYLALITQSFQLSSHTCYKLDDTPGGEIG